MEEILKTERVCNIFQSRESLIELGGISEDEIIYFINYLEFKERKVVIAVNQGDDMVVSVEGQDDDDAKRLIDGFSKAVQHESFCKYNLKTEGAKAKVSFQTYEWDVTDPNGRFNTLSKQGDVVNLVDIP